MRTGMASIKCVRSVLMNGEPPGFLLDDLHQMQQGRNVCSCSTNAALDVNGGGDDVVAALGRNSHDRWGWTASPSKRPGKGRDHFIGVHVELVPEPVWKTSTGKCCM